jgi:5'-deoxynucleotidase YfbR-like HD superfamily hydrolase
MKQRPDIRRLISFQRLLLQFQAVERVTHVAKGEAFRAENDTEHSYNLAMAAWFLSAYFPHLDQDKLIRYALAHDLVEIHAGDTYIYADQAQLNTKADREAKALRQLEADWPDFRDMTATIHAYESKTDEESKFVYALDKIMPILVIFISEGYTWQKEGITPERLDSVKRHKVRLSPEIAPYYDELYELLQKHRHYFTDDPTHESSQQR